MSVFKSVSFFVFWSFFEKVGVGFVFGFLKYRDIGFGFVFSTRTSSVLLLVSCHYWGDLRSSVSVTDSALAWNTYSGGSREHRPMT